MRRAREQVNAVRVAEIDEREAAVQVAVAEAEAASTLAIAEARGLREAVELQMQSAAVVAPRKPLRDEEVCASST